MRYLDRDGEFIHRDQWWKYFLDRDYALLRCYQTEAVRLTASWVGVWANGHEPAPKIFCVSAAGTHKRITPALREGIWVRTAEQAIVAFESAEQVLVGG